MIATAQIKDATSAKFQAAVIYIQHQRRGSAPSQLQMLAALDGMMPKRERIPQKDLASVIGCHPADLYRMRWAIANNDWRGRYSMRPAKQWSLP